MSRVVVAEEVSEDFDRIVEHLREYEVENAESRLAEIGDALVILQRHPLIGRKYSNELRELVISKVSRGYVALYRYQVEVDTSFVLAIRAQKEAGYARDFG